MTQGHGGLLISSHSVAFENEKVLPLNDSTVLYQATSPGVENEHQIKPTSWARPKVD